VCLACAGLAVGIWMNIDDKKNRNSQLNKIHFKASDSKDTERIN
jgi:hypothetical protein